ncbi:MAG: hypothetical protein DDG60_13970 [Anaerolineae bacterium]|nr:MAG: hypothetical protein DDG60_13970 [Anaerolineae bacterium]
MKRLTWKTGCLAMALVCVAAYYGYRFLEGKVPLSTLPVYETEEKKWDDLVDIDFPLLWPSNEYQSSPPLAFLGKAFSPDGQYYVQLVKSRWRERAFVCLFESRTGHRLGYYSFHRLIIYRWAEDSSGVYLSDYVPGWVNVLIFYHPAYISPVKKVLVPCVGSLEGVSLLPRLYWEMRCAFPAPHSFIAVWLPLVVVVTLVAAGGWVGLQGALFLWRRVIRPWWYGA